MSPFNRKFAVGALVAAIAIAGGRRLATAQDHGEGHAPAPAAHGDTAGHGETAPAPAAHGDTAGHGETAGHGATKGGHEGAAHGGHHGPADINWTDLSDKSRPAYVALLINFGILFALYYTLGKKPILEALRQRRVTVGKDIDEARKMLEEAKERAKKYQGDLKNADADAEAARTALVGAGKGEVDRLLREANEKAERMKRDAERLVEQERKQVRADLHKETVDLALGEATKLLERSVTPEDHARLAEDLLAELARRPSANVGGAS